MRWVSRSFSVTSRVSWSSANRKSWPRMSTTGVSQEYLWIMMSRVCYPLPCPPGWKLPAFRAYTCPCLPTFRAYTCPCLAAFCYYTCPCLNVFMLNHFPCLPPPTPPPLSTCSCVPVFRAYTSLCLPAVSAYPQSVPRALYTLSVPICVYAFPC